MKVDNKLGHLRKGIIWFFILFPIVCCGGSLLFLRRWVDTFDEAADAQHELAEAKKHGFPIIADDLRPVPRVQDVDNAYIAISNLMKNQPKGMNIRKLANDFHPTKGAQVPQALQTFEAESKSLRTLHGYDAHRDYDNPATLKYDDLTFCRNLCLVLGRCAEQAAINGDLQHALENLQLIRQIGEWTNQEKDFEALFSWMAIDQVFETTSLRVYQEAGENEIAYQEIRKMLSQPLVAPNFLDCTRGDYYIELARLRNMILKSDNDSDLDENQPQAPPIRSGLPKGIFQRALIGSYTKHKMAIDDRYRAAKTLSEGADAEKSYIASIPSSVTNYLSKMVILDSSSIAKHFDGLVQAQGLSIEALDAAHRHSTPSGAHQIYLKTTKGFLLYLVGPNGKDNGGPKKVGVRPRSDDIGYEYPFVESK